MQDFSLIIDGMTWSYSRLTAYTTCPYSWFLKYILGEDTSSNFYAEYGTFMHELLSKFYKNEASKDSILLEFLTGFSHNVPSIVDSQYFESTKEKYFDLGAEYLETFKPFDFKKLITVEGEHNFKIDKYKFTGFIDLAGYDENNDLVIIDHKSKDLKPRSNRKKPTLTDIELDEYLQQLYLYCIPIFNLTGEYPKWLKYNCFKADKVIVEPFVMANFEKAKRWARHIIEFIQEERKWEPTGNYIYCKDICNNRNICEYVD